MTRGEGCFGEALIAHRSVGAVQNAANGRAILRPEWCLFIEIVDRHAGKSSGNFCPLVEAKTEVPLGNERSAASVCLAVTTKPLPDPSGFVVISSHASPG